MEQKKHLSRNFLLNGLNGTCTKLAEQLAHPGITLSWIFNALGAPAFLIGLLMPVKQLFSLLPQLLVSGRIRRLKKRKIAWTGAGATQGTLLLAAAGTVYASSRGALAGITAAWIIIALLVLFYSASGVGSVSYKDVMGRTIPQGRRGKLLAFRATSGGILSLGGGALLYLVIDGSGSLSPYVYLLGSAGALWIIAAFLFSAIQEPTASDRDSRTFIEELRKGAHILREDKNFRRFIYTRMLVLILALALPFYVRHGMEVTGTAIRGLGLFIIANAGATILASPVWGSAADRSSRRVLIAASLLGAATAVYALVLPRLPNIFHTFPLYAPVLFLNALAYTGARLARKTYLVDFAPEKERPLYAALANTLVGAATVIGSVFGLIAQWWGVETLIVIFIFGLAAAALSAFRLEEAETQ